MLSRSRTVFSKPDENVFDLLLTFKWRRKVRHLRTTLVSIGLGFNKTHFSESTKSILYGVFHARHQTVDLSIGVQLNDLII